ncbi:MAG: DUF309 domain-containing protein [Chloroflexi bacterium]|nr:MAG: DUF309 domain-containing protein [Chloroflexota bacterium]
MAGAPEPCGCGRRGLVRRLRPLELPRPAAAFRLRLRPSGRQRPAAPRPWRLDRIRCRAAVPAVLVTPGLRRGVELFNSGRYWDAHEVWEHEWMPDRKGPEAGFYKGLIQVAAGCLHYSRRNRRGAVNKWRSGADYLRPYLPQHRGIDLASLVRSVDGYLHAMGERGWPDLVMPIIA